MTSHPRLRVARLSLTPVKGMAHAAPESLEFIASGPRHDREFCLMDQRTGRVVRTVEDDLTMACQASWDPPRLTIRTPVGTASGVVADGKPLVADYWGRPTEFHTVDGPWSEVLSEHLGRPVVLCRVREPGAVVWAAPVSLVTTSSLEEVARRARRPSEDGTRFRATVVVDTGTAPSFVEDGWVGRSLELGGATVTVTGRTERCAVVDRRPGAGGVDVRVLAALVDDRAAGGGGAPTFGVHGVVARPGVVTRGATVRLA